MDNKKNINRRNLLKLSVGFAAGSAISAFTFHRSYKNDPDCTITPRQELGPFAPMKSRNQSDHDIDLTQVEGQTGKAAGKVMVVHGKILDDVCKPVEGAIVEIWQSNHYGKYNHEYDPNGTHDPNFQGWGQAITNKSGEYRFKTILPGLYGGRTRHIHYKIAKRGYHELVTQLYFEGEERNKKDGLLNALTHDEQQKVIKKPELSEGIPIVEFNINIAKIIQGRLPAKVLAEYNGNYEWQYKGHAVEGFVNSMLGGPYEKVIMKVENEGDLLFFTLPFAPKTEIIWKEKDRFDAMSFYRSELHFIRGANGRITELEIISEKERGVKAIKV